MNFQTDTKRKVPRIKRAETEEQLNPQAVLSVIELI